MRQELTATNFSCSFLVLNEPIKTKFETSVTDAIDDVLSALGNSNKQAIFNYLENRHGMKKEAIPFKIEDFTRAIEQTFGSAAKIIEVKIIESLHKKRKDFAYVPKTGEIDFVEYVYDLQNYLQLEN